MSRWAREFALGARLAVAGGRDAWTRTAMTAVGVGLGVALLLFAASIPQLVAARDARTDARTGVQVVEPEVSASASTLLVGFADTDFRELDIRGRMLQPEGPRAPLPPGVARLPGPGEMVVSPRLERLLASSDGALLRPRLGARIVGTIADAGLAGPGEYAFYAGARDLRPGEAERVRRFGRDAPGAGLHPVLALLVVVAFTVLLLPVLIFVAAAARFGGEARDRRLAAMRLVGADRRMARRIAAGEALLGALLGLVVGAAVFLFARQLVERVTLADLSAFAQDVQPSLPLVLLIAVTVPAASVAVTLLALRSVAIEPLGVVRRAQPRRRRIWWRLLPPLAGCLLLVDLIGVEGRPGASFDERQVVAGVVLLLIGVAAIAPWLVEAVVHRLGRGGGVAWQLATRRLQLDSGASARVVTGVVVAVAGAIALQTMFAEVERASTTATGADLGRAQAYTSLDTGRRGPGAAAVTARLRTLDGVRSALALDEADLDLWLRVRGRDHSVPLTIADCRSLRELVATARCADGDAFVVHGRDAPRAGERLRVGRRGAWTVPHAAATVDARVGPAGGRTSGVLLTPKAAAGLELPGRRTVVYLGLDPSRPDAIEHVRNAVAAIDATSLVTLLAATRQDDDFADVRRGVFAGAVAVLLLIGASMLVSALEQLRERRRLLAVLVAFGTPRTTLGWSVLFQAAVPVALGLALAVVTGTALGALLLGIVGASPRPDLAAIAGLTALGAAVVLLVTVLSLPLLWRLVRSDGLRTE